MLPLVGSPVPQGEVLVGGDLWGVLLLVAFPVPQGEVLVEGDL